MDLIEKYLSRSQEIIGDRTRAEIGYDNEVVGWLRKGKDLKKAIKKANKKYPNDALKLDSRDINDVALTMITYWSMTISSEKFRINAPSANIPLQRIRANPHHFERFYLYEFSCLCH